MPPAAATHQIVGETDRLNEVPHKTYHKYLFGDIANEMGQLHLLEADNHLNGTSRGGASLSANVKAADPRVGNATIVAQYTDRRESSRIVLLSMVPPGSGLYMTISDTPVFPDGESIWNYLNGPDVVYIRPPDDVAQEHIRKVRNWTYLDLPVAKQDISVCLHWKAMLTGHNQMLHPNMNINHADLMRTYIHGLPPEAKLAAIEQRDNLTLARQNSCCFPAVHPAHHPQAGAAHPQAGQLSLDLLAIYVHKKFGERVRAGLIRLKGQPQPSINVTDDCGDDTTVTTTGNPGVSPSSTSPGSSTPSSTSNFEWVSVFMLGHAGYTNFHDYAVYELGREAARSMRTCRNCGGINHFSHKDGVLVCPTPDGSVPVHLLRNIKYPLGVNPWRFGSGKGSKGKGGIGKGGKGKGGRGRGGYWVDATDPWDWEQPMDTTQDNLDQSVDFVVDDYDGFNQ